MKFYKYQCLENDFIITENNVLNITDLCDQHKGIGADGLMIIKDTNIEFFNKDGSKAILCGNGIRCAAKYFNDLDKPQNSYCFEGKHYKITNTNNLYTLKHPISDIEKKNKLFFVTAGVNHIVLFKKPSFKKAKHLNKRYNSNITFFYNQIATTYESGVGFTRGCGTGLISVISVLNKINNINLGEIFSPGGKSNFSVQGNYILLESEVHMVYEGLINNV